MVDYHAIGQRIRFARTKAQMTQERLANLANLSLPHVSNIETGNTKVSLPTLIKLANILDVSLDDLVCDNIKHAKETFCIEAQSILEDCNDYETRFLVELLKAAKNTLRKKYEFP